MSRRRECICADPENCRVPVPGCKAALRFQRAVFGPPSGERDQYPREQNRDLPCLCGHARDYHDRHDRCRADDCSCRRYDADHELDEEDPDAHVEVLGDMFCLHEPPEDSL